MHDLTPLYDYINSQRRAGVADSVTYHNLLGAGWTPEAVSHAMNTSNQPAMQNPAQNTSHHNIQQNYHQPTQQHPAETANLQHQARGLFTGRIGRLQFFVANLYILLVMGAILAIGLTTSLLIDSVVVLIFNFLLFLAGLVATLVLSLGAYARRWHDLGQSGWFALFWLAVGSILFLILVIIKGKNEPNQYGPAPTNRLSPKSVFGF